MTLRKLTPADLKLGMLTPWNIYGEKGTLLVRKGHLISSMNQMELLIERGSFDDLSDQQAPVKAPEPPSALRKLNIANLELATLLDLIANRMAPPDTRRRLQDIGAMVNDAVELSPDVSIASILHNQKAGPYSTRHSVDTAVVAQMAARALKVSPGDRMSMTLAALTMNVGMMGPLRRLLDASAELNEADRVSLRQHPELGVELLKLAGVIDPLWLEYVLHHHENEDGTGYPFGKAGTQVPGLAKVIALADRYTARISNRNFRKSIAPNAALRDILLEARSTLDSNLTATVIRELGIYPIGTYVRLLNGEVGVVWRRGLQSTTPHVKSIAGPRGAPLNQFLDRDTRGDLNGIKEVLSAAQVAALAIPPLRMEQIWGRVAAL